MCNLHSKTDLKEVTVYKAARKINGEYYSFFARSPVRIGKVIPQAKETMCSDILFDRYLYKPERWCYNLIMTGKCSGFQLKEHAFTLVNTRSWLREIENEIVVLKITLGGEIWMGNAEHIHMDIPDEDITYAGTEILDFEVLDETRFKR